YTDLSKITSTLYLIISIYLFLFTFMAHKHFYKGMKRPHDFTDSNNNPIQFTKDDFLNKFQNEFQLKKAPLIVSFNVSLGKSIHFIDKNDESMRIGFNFIMMSSRVGIILSKSAISLATPIDEFIESYSKEITNRSE
ncbi:MAG: hypothetical protein ACXADB_10505, partial [Candidatus Hermodarchaeia archaeon]